MIESYLLVVLSQEVQYVSCISQVRHVGSQTAQRADIPSSKNLSVGQTH